MNRRTPASSISVSFLIIASLIYQLPVVGYARFIPASTTSSSDAERAAVFVRQAVPNNAALTAGNLAGANATVTTPVMPFFAPTSVTATLADDIGLGATKNPGATITYTAIINNAGGPSEDATGMVFTANLDPNTTLVGSSLNAQPIAKADTYTGTGNIPISIAAPGVLTNDVDPMTGTNAGLTVTEVQGAAGNVGVATDTTAVGANLVKGSVTLASTGNFTYEPPPGYLGTDTFTYKTSEGTLTDTNTVTITITNMAWFIKNTGVSSNRGTFSNPFTSIASFNTANALADAAPNPKSGDTISLRTGTYAEGDGVNLRGTQKLIGEAIQFNTVFTADSNSSSAYTTFAGATNTAPTISTSAGNGIDLASGNTVRGLNVGNTPGFYGFNGGVVGSPVINTVAKTGTGGAINVTTSGAFSTNVIFSTLESSSSPGANINLVGITGTLGITSGGAGLTGSAASSHAITINGGSVGFTYPGDVTKASLGALLNVSGGHTGTLTFNTGTLSGTNGTGLQFDNADGAYNFNGTSTLNGGDAGVDILNGSGGTFSFSGNTSITNPTGTCFTVNGSTVGITYSGNITKSGTSAGLLIDITNEASGTITFQTGTLLASSTAAGSTGIQLSNADGTVNFNGTNTLNGVGGNAGIDIITGCAGTFSFSSNTAITNPSGIAYNEDTSTASVTYNGTILQSNAGSAVKINAKTGGTTSFNKVTGGQIAASTTTANAIDLTNTGGTINFSGGVSLTTTSGVGFNASGSGATVNVCDESPCNPAATGALVNTITTTTGTGLNVANTTIGSNNLEFQKISAGTGAGSGGDGIILDTTGASGGLKVKGTGAAGTGGTIQHKTGADGSNTAGIGIYLNSTQNVSLNWMQLNDFDNFAIRGTAVSGLTMDRIVTTGTNGNNGGFDEATVAFGYTTVVDANPGLTGSVSITNCNFGGGSVEDTFRVRSGAGSLNRITMTNDTFACLNTTGDALKFETANSGVINATVQNSFITSAAGDQFNFIVNGTATDDLVFTGNTLTNNNPLIATGGGGVTISGGDNGGSLTYNIDNNTFRDAVGIAVLIVKSTGAGTYSGTFSNNTIGVQATTNSGSKEGDGMKLQNAGQGTFTIHITGNHIYQYNLYGIEMVTGGGATAQSGFFNATITGNTISNPGNNPGVDIDKNGVHLNAGTVPADTYSICLTLGGAGALANSITGSGAPAPVSGGGQIDFRLRQRQSTTVRLPGYGGAFNDTAAVIAFVKGNNGGTPTGAASVNSNGFVGGAACPLLLAMGGIMSSQDMFPLVHGFDFSALSYMSATRPSPVSDSLTQAQLDSIVSASIQRWSATGLTAQQTAALRGIKFEVTDLSAAYLGEADGNRIQVDRNAEGKGWFVDANPLSDSSFLQAVSATRLYTDPINAAAGHVDLLTAIEHEMGHKLGLDDIYAEEGRDNLMYGYLTVGERRSPARGQAKGVQSGALKGSHFLSLGLAATPLDVRKVADLPTDRCISSSGLPPGVGAQPQLIEPRLPVGRSRHRTSGGRAVERQIWSAVASPAQHRFGLPASPSKAPSPLRSAGALQKKHHATNPLKRTSASDDQPLSPLSGETVTVNGAGGAGFTLPGGDSVTITFQATVNTPPGARSVSVQGKVSGTNFALVNGITTASPNTNDPETAAVNDATVTNINTVSTWTGATSTDWKTFTNWTPNTYAPGVGNAAVNDVFIPNVGLQPNINALVGDVSIYSLNISNNRTLTIDPARILTIGGAPGGDLTLDGIISGGQLRFGTGTHALNNAGGTGSLSPTNVAFVISGSTVTLNHNLQAGALAVSAGGSLNITGKTLSLNGAGAALGVAGTFTTTTSTIVLNGTAAQTIAGTTYNNLMINNTLGAHVTGVTLIGNATVNGVLTLTSSDLATGANTLTMPVGATSAPASGATDVVGNVKRTGFVINGAALSFGNPLNTIKINTGSTLAPTDINILIAKNAPATYAAAVQRSYTITPNGGSGINATVRLHYRQAELNGNVDTSIPNFNFRRFTAGAWKAVVPTSRNTNVVEDNWLENNAVTTFSEWTFANLSPSAASGTVQGTITDNNGTPVEGTVVRLSGDQDRKTITDAKGRYYFDNVDVNGFYTVTPSRVNYHFNPFNRAFTQLGNQTEAAFGASFTGDNANPLDTPEYFVRQQYVDLLGREPDEGGFNYWSDRLLECGADADCMNQRRSDIAAAFFIEQEFQQTGSYIDALYKGSLGRRPAFTEYSADRKLVIGGPDLETEKTAFAADFVKRPEFLQKYQSNTTGESFVDALLANVWQTSNLDLGTRRGVLLALYQTGGDMNQGRALVLRQLSEDPSMKSVEYNPAFVLTEYFGYLRRNPEAEGYDFWLNVLDKREPGNFRGMVCSFITSTEYQKRFSAVVTHSNSECGQH
jgi:hypothetical protein